MSGSSSSSTAADTSSPFKQEPAEPSKSSSEATGPSQQAESKWYRKLGSSEAPSTPKREKWRDASLSDKERWKEWNKAKDKEKKAGYLLRERPLRQLLTSYEGQARVISAPFTRRRRAGRGGWGSRWRRFASPGWLRRKASAEVATFRDTNFFITAFNMLQRQMEIPARSRSDLPYGHP